uniref:HDC13539 n=1 Tax=Drosophila melanogaster TaxID=7227 RepID=Q6IK20_DROME|nr:TPA_inf: HDC13539 [Drosophila melanogaster]
MDKMRPSAIETTVQEIEDADGNGMPKIKLDRLSDGSCRYCTYNQLKSNLPRASLPAPTIAHQQPPTTRRRHLLLQLIIPKLTIRLGQINMAIC